MPFFVHLMIKLGKQMVSFKSYSVKRIKKKNKSVTSTSKILCDKKLSETGGCC